MPSPTFTTQPVQVTTLIVVCCHAVFIGNHDTANIQDETHWLIEPFQSGEIPTFIAHIKEGVRSLKSTGGKGMLVFSGGATKRKRLSALGPELEGKTEGGGYWEIASKLLSEDHSITNDARSLLQTHMFHEDHATDSYQNILLSLIQYPIWKQQIHDNHLPSSPYESNSGEWALALPDHLITISHAFKQARFTNLHLPAIRSLLPEPLQEQFNAMIVDYVGIDPPFTAEKLADIREGDRKRGYGVWKDDVHGTGELLSQKRKDRGWDEEAFFENLRRTCGLEIGKDVVGLVRGWKCAE